MLKNRLTRAAAVVAATTTLGLVAPVTSAQAAVTPSAYALEARTQTNAERTERSVATLSYSSCLRTYSTRQARAMAAAKRMHHQDLRPILSACGLSRVGENVAVGYPSGKATVVGWMASSGHRANILDPTFTQGVVSAAQDSSGRWYVAQVFGTPR
ncbi:CAP domain-containing protein [Auraticoccus monumenti]|uniref:Uncharacterized conserved protein YkwD, contains CAP (CSP/antigen 5/PR1) domain n=1 Tax=Auraticoccus monumenti TaxID=675864 RepID=A0A1G7DY78_9ACTN|nr:CAP domain-containing protein [Auraticoccus monumenti]SDE56341.1 Uncharacterized conserved protein YkwD, contains CAP (CSP/antigen 5/PR1) domain [Auraticoccus monumenti]